MSSERFPQTINAIAKLRRKPHVVEEFPKDLSGYLPLELIGHGSSGAVYRARQRSTGRDVAIKLFNPGKFSTGRGRPGWARESAIPSHPHIACLIDAGKTGGGRSYAISEFVPGETLRHYLLRNGALYPDFAATVMAQVLDALACIHACGIVHCDIKPENILLTATGARANVKLIDFSIAARTARPRQPKAAILGTPLYCSPEQLRGEPPTPAADLYAWGLVFVECLSGRAAVPHLLPVDAVHFQMSDEMVSLPPILRGHVLEPLLRDVLAKDARYRASDAAALHTRLQNSLRGEAAMASRDASALIQPEPLPEVSHAVSVLCVSTALVPLSSTTIDMGLLVQLQEEQQQICLQAMRQGGGHLIGVLDHRFLFHFGGADCDEGLWCAAFEFAQLRDDCARRSRLLAIHHGAVVDLQAGLYWDVVEPARQEGARILAVNAALRLHRLAKPDGVVVNPAAQERMCRILTGEEYEKLGACVPEAAARGNGDGGSGWRVNR